MLLKLQRLSLILHLTLSETTDNLELNIVLRGPEDLVFVADGFIEIIK